MEVEIPRTDTQPNGPRVSFNRDVHVKRIGKRINESNNHPIQTKNLQPADASYLRREPPNNLDQRSILKEAALVLKQVERTKCKAEPVEESKVVTPSLKYKQSKVIATANKFNSLPTRRKNKSGKLLARSVSDASAKKNKKPSIFNLFNRRSDTNLTQIDEDIRFKESGGRRLIRGKSNLTDFICKENDKSALLENDKIDSENENIDHNIGVIKQIVGNVEKACYINEAVVSDDNFKNIALRNNFRKEEIKENRNLTRNSSNRLSNKENSPPYAISSSNANISKYQATEDLSTKKDTEDPYPSINLKAMYKDMHCSQLPPEKLPLTKGLTVDGMVKRLILERFSPPPAISGPVFSYTRPNEAIIYAQLTADDFEDRNEEILVNTTTKESESSPNSDFQISNSCKVTETARVPSYFTNQNDSSGHNNSEIYLTDFYQHDQEPKPFSKIFFRGQNSSPQRNRHSPRNLSDDEGLGFESKKYFDDELSNQTSTSDNHFNALQYIEQDKSLSVEPLTVPVIHGSLPPIDLTMNKRRGGGIGSHQEDYPIKAQNEFNNLKSRREALESKIYSRKFVSNKWQPLTDEHNDYHDDNLVLNVNKTKHPKIGKRSSPNKIVRHLYLERGNNDKLDNLQSLDIFENCSPAQASSNSSFTSKQPELKSSKHVRTQSFDDDSHKNIYEKEINYDQDEKSRVIEFFKKDLSDSSEILRDLSLFKRDHCSTDFRSKNSDNLFQQSRKKTSNQSQQDEKWDIKTLTHNRKSQPSFDKGDSGIENDFRKESFNSDFLTKWRDPIPCDVMKLCDLFLRKERRHTEDLHQYHKKYDFVFRERSIDDGSHFDPRLDKYSQEAKFRNRVPFSLNRKTALLTKSNFASEIRKQKDGVAKTDRKIGGLEKVKKLFGGKKKEKKEFSSGSEKSNSIEKDNYMVNEEEMRSRYMEYRGPEAKETHSNDISTRRRLSTPRASPSLKRSQSEEEIQSSHIIQQIQGDEKVEKASWFKSLDRNAKKKNEKKHLASSSFRSPTKEDLFIVSKAYSKPLTQGMSEKNFRFFGDTDMESNPPTISKGTKASRTRNNIEFSILNQSQKYSQSAYNLDHIPNKYVASQTKSSSMQNLDERKNMANNVKITLHHSRSKNKLKDIYESGSETEGRDVLHKTASKSREKKSGKHQSNSNMSPNRSNNSFDTKLPLGEVSSDPAIVEFRKPPQGPRKPIRNPIRSRHSSSFSRERDPLQDSSGTEGDSSLNSQRSVVYLHAATVGDIPQPYQMSPSKRRTIPRDKIHYKRSDSLHKTHEASIEPMAKSVSRSVSMIAPWTPKQRSDAQEINYSPDTPANSEIGKPKPKASRKYSGSGNSLGRSKNNNIKPRKFTTSKEDSLTPGNSFQTTARVVLSNRPLMYEKRDHGSKHDVSRHTIK